MSRCWPVLGNLIYFLLYNSLLTRVILFLLFGWNYSPSFLKVYSIVNEEPNAEECKARIKAYEEANRAQIVIRQSQRADEERSIQDRIAAEQREAERRKRELQEEEKAMQVIKRKLKQESTQVLLGVSFAVIPVLNNNPIKRTMKD